MGEFEAADALRNGAGEGAFFVADSSLSNKPVGIAAQLTFTNVRSRRPLR